MAKRTKTDANQQWCKANASPEEFGAAFRSYCETQWGLPNFATIRLIIEARRTSKAAA